MTVTKKNDLGIKIFICTRIINNKYISILYQLLS